MWLKIFLFLCFVDYEKKFIIVLVGINIRSVDVVERRRLMVFEFDMVSLNIQV